MAEASVHADMRMAEAEAAVVPHGPAAESVDVVAVVGP